MRVMKPLHWLLWTMALLGASAALGQQQVTRISLPGHVPTALALAAPANVASQSLLTAPLNFTIVLRRADAAGFAAYLRDVYDAKSPQYRKFMSPLTVSEKFGPSVDDYATVRDYFERQGFRFVEASKNRMTLTMSAPRAVAERALSIHINDYQIGTQTFYANDTDPSLPASIASKVEAVTGLSNLAQPAPQWNAIVKAFNQVIYELCKLLNNPATQLNNASAAATTTPPTQTCTAPSPLQSVGPTGDFATSGSGGVPWGVARGAGQKVGLLEYDTFVQGDVVNYLNLAGLPAANISKLSQFHVNGGAALGPRQDEVLLDIAAIMTIASGAQVVVYDAPFSGGGASFQAIFNAMVNDNVTVISNSWSYCEDQTTLADVQSIDAIFQTAAASGISVFNASGDSGSTCLDGSPNTVGVPASSPSATAVGATTLTVGPGGTYLSETWWNGTTHMPPTGQGGYGVSRYFARPAYQNGFTSATMRSIPDVVANGDPATGWTICMQTNGGCPNGALYGGTSVAAPTWAAYTAVLNEAQGQNLGSLNPQIYPLAATAAFHGPASMGSDFAHVGLGSPNTNLLNLGLAGQVATPPTAIASSMVPFTSGAAPTLGAPAANPPADGVTPTYVVVWLRDVSGNMVSGKNVTLTKNGGSSAVISPPNGVSSVSNGAVVFTVTNLIAEDVTFTATDTTDGVVLSPQTVRFAVPAAASAGISANPLAVQSDGVATTTITVTLQDALARPTPGKLITLSQGAGHSIVSGPSPSVTNAAGQIQFTATNVFNETVTYTAVDVTDGNLAIPGSAVVTFSGSANAPCSTPPTAASGYQMIPFSSGYAAGNFNYGGVNWGGCGGASNPTFDTTGSVFVSDFFDGKLYKFDAGGGAVSSANVLANLGRTLRQPVYSTDGNLYVLRAAASNAPFTGDVIQVDPNTGAIIRTLVTGLNCASDIAVDPISGDIFFTNACFGGGFESPSLFRVLHTSSTDPLPPVLTTYLTLPTATNGSVSFSPDGTIYVASNYLVANPAIYRIGGTNTPQPASITTVPGVSALYWVTVAATLPGGAAKSLVVLTPPGNALSLFDLTTGVTTPITVGGASSGIVGSDGCLYFGASYAIYKLTTSTGSCGFASTNPTPSLTLSPPTVTPDPAQGTAQSLTATFNNLNVPAGTGVTFSIQGSNQQVRSALTDATGKATTTYQGILTGTDRIVASATVGAVSLASNKATINWTSTAGKHVTFISLNGTILSGNSSASVTFSAALFDVSVTPNVPLSGATLQFVLNGQSCNAVTNGSGVAACALTLPNTAGLYPLVVTYAGTSSRTSASSTQEVSVTGPAPGASSRKVHGAAGTFNLALSPDPLNPTVEPRTGPLHTIVFPFDSVVTSATAAITEGIAVAGTPTFTPGGEVIVPLTGVADQQYVTITLSNVVNAAGGNGTASVRVGFLSGDVTQNRVVAVSDLGTVNAALTQTVTATTYLKDINANGAITVADKAIVNGNLTHSLPPP